MIASAAASPPPALSPATTIRLASKPSTPACPASHASAEWQSSCGAGKGCSGASRYSTEATGTPAAAVYAFTDRDIVVTREQGFQPFPPLDQTHNGIQASYPEPAAGWTVVRTDTSEVPPDLIEDGVPKADVLRQLPCYLGKGIATAL